MYHAFASGGAPDRFIQPERSFARQMAVLRALRYRVIALDQLIDALQTGGRLPRRAVVLTADDGYEDNLRIVRPILRKRGFPVTIFLVTGRLGKTNDWSTGSTAGRPLMSAEQARETQGEGLELGAHTRRHRSLPDAEAAEIREEVEGSRADLEALLAKPIRTFAYPYGHVDERTRAVVRDSGFEMALSVDDRRATVAEDPMRVPRIEIRGTDSILRFLRRLWL
jgi:peptidoglycan/xylan/chitin deacetylase (PgdA/CDA1 family)